MEYEDLYKILLESEQLESLSYKYDCIFQFKDGKLKIKTWKDRWSKLNGEELDIKIIKRFIKYDLYSYKKIRLFFKYVYYVIYKMTREQLYNLPSLTESIVFKKNGSINYRKTEARVSKVPNGKILKYFAIPYPIDKFCDFTKIELLDETKVEDVYIECPECKGQGGKYETVTNYDSKEIVKVSELVRDANGYPDHEVTYLKYGDYGTEKMFIHCSKCRGEKGLGSLSLIAKRNQIASGINIKIDKIKPMISEYLPRYIPLVTELNFKIDIWNLKHNWHEYWDVMYIKRKKS